jgi:hypothetical protein
MMKDWYELHDEEYEEMMDLLASLAEEEDAED